MPGYINTEELKMFGTNLPICKEVGKKIVKDMGISIFHFIQWGGCFIFTLLLLTSNTFVYAMQGLSDLIFIQWDKYMEYVDRKRIIKERTKDNDGEDYLVRYYLFLKGSSGSNSRRFPYNIFLHKFLKSDDSVMHDHPWSYTTLIISGGYWEHIPVTTEDGKTIDTRFWRGPGYWNSYSCDHKHWIELPKESLGHFPTSSCWTLFIPGIKNASGKWGFYPNLTNNEQTDEWIEADQYLASSCDDNKKDK